VYKDLNWSIRALQEYKDLLDYIADEWGETIMDRVKSEFTQTLSRIQNSPEQFSVFLKRKNIRRCIASPQTSIYFKINKNDIEIYAVFDNRRNPKKLKL
jgi:plasmid stabilization system protein ParE